MVVGAAALTVIVIATLVFMSATGRPPSALMPSHVAPTPSAIPPGYFVFPLNTTTAYVLVTSSPSSSPTLYLTVDGGRDWRRLTLPIPISDRLAAANLLADGKLIIETWDRSDQQLTHAYVGDMAGWTVVKPPIPSGGWPHMLDSRVGVYIVSGQSASNNGHDLSIFRTLDSGTHWEQMLQLDAAHPNAGGLSITDDHFVGFTDAAHGWVVSTAQPYATVCGPTGWTPAGRLLASEDGGQTWSERLLSPLPDGSALLEPPVMIRGSAGYMLASVQSYAGKCPPGADEYAYSTTDVGVTWSAPRRLPVEFFSTLDGIDWWATDGKSLLRSRDQGASWTSQDARLPARDVMLGDIYPVGADTAWSFWVPAVNQTGRAALLRTTDGGATWAEVRLPRA
jgi:photosystem II stability/assembly factor-like uncharacterized protein